MAKTLPSPTAAGIPADRENPVSAALLSRSRQAAFERIVSEHQASVVGLAYRLLGWTGDVDDVVQDVFLAVFNQLDRFESRARFSTWLTTITVNACRTQRRKRLLRLKFMLRAADRAKTAWSTAPDRPALDAESGERVRGAVRGLSPRYREVVVLRYLEEMPIDEIGAVLGLKRNAVEVRLNRARRRLKEMLGDEMERWSGG